VDVRLHRHQRTWVFGGPDHHVHDRRAGAGIKERGEWMIIEALQNLHPVMQTFFMTCFIWLVTACGATLVFFTKSVNKKARAFYGNAQNKVKPAIPHFLEKSELP